MPQRIIAILMFIAAVVCSAEAQETTATTTTTTEASSTDNDSNDTREALQIVLGKYPPQVGRVLKLDPTLFANQAYLANYPGLATFVTQHPEVAHTPAFYLESIWVPNDLVPESPNMRMWRDTMEGVFVVMVTFVIAGAFVWLIRTLIEHRRWSRLTRTQAEVHNKLLDRFTGNEELLAYIQTPSGKRFLESAPIPLDAGPRAVSAPIGRILWSVQVGVIVIAAGVGLRMIGLSIDKTVVMPLLAMGILAIAIGAGFLVSAFVSFILSKRLGLLGTGAADAPALTE